jgi:hypothetical protein
MKVLIKIHSVPLTPQHTTLDTVKRGITQPAINTSHYLRLHLPHPLKVSQVHMVGSRQVMYHRAYSMYMCIVYRCVYAGESNKRGDLEPKLRRRDGVEGNHESENVEWKRGARE